MKKTALPLLTTACVCIPLFFSACSKKSAAEADAAGTGTNSNVLYLFNWTYYTPDSVLRQFEQKYNCTVKVDSYDSNEVMYAKLKAGGGIGYDITIPGQDYVAIMKEQGMLEKIDQQQFTNRKYINPEVLKKSTVDPGMEYSVPYYFGASGICVNKQKLQNYSRSWNIFEDSRIAEHASMMDDMREVLGDALAYLGYSVNTTDEKQLKEAAALVADKWKPNLVKFDAEGFGKSFAAGDFWVCQGYAEVVYGEVPEEKWDDMIDFFIPEEGGPAYYECMVILKGSKHYDLAMKFINFIHEPQIYAEFLDAFRFPASVNLEAAKYTTKTPMYTVDDLKNCEIRLDLGEHLGLWNEHWQDIRFSAN